MNKRFNSDNESIYAYADQRKRQTHTYTPLPAAIGPGQLVADVPRAKACGDQQPATTRAVVLFTQQNGAAGSTAGKEGAGVATAPGAVAAAGAAVLHPPPEAGQASTPKKASE